MLVANVSIFKNIGDAYRLVFTGTGELNRVWGLWVAVLTAVWTSTEPKYAAPFLLVAAVLPSMMCPVAWQRFIGLGELPDNKALLFKALLFQLGRRECIHFVCFLAIVVTSAIVTAGAEYAVGLVDSRSFKILRSGKDASLAAECDAGLWRRRRVFAFVVALVALFAGGRA